LANVVQELRSALAGCFDHDRLRLIVSERPDAATSAGRKR
jgi:hypothetical protein